MVNILKLLNEAYEVSTYRGDTEYSIICTGDCVGGDEVAFERATFSGSFRSPHFDGFELVKGKIIKDSYGADKQQHTFTLQKDDGTTFRIKGRNLYGNGTYRKRWKNEDERKVAQDEKHERGNAARAIRDQRRELEKQGF